MTFKYALLVVGIAIAIPTLAFAQGTIRGAEHGADEGGAAAGPIGAIVGGAVGAATGTVGGVLGVGRDPGCESKTVTREDQNGDSTTVRRTNCP